MKKTVILGMAALLSGCSCLKCNEKPAVQTEVKQEPVFVAVNEPCPCEQKSGCIARQEPVLLKPRVTETVSLHKKRACCVDEQNLDEEKTVTFVPDAPEIYVISANRALNAMQDEAAVFFEKSGKMRVYVAPAAPKVKDLPGGIDKGTEVIKARFAKMENVRVVENKLAADYVVHSTADWYDTATKTIPAIKYSILLRGRDGHLVGQWNEIIHQAEGDRSWW